MASIEQRGNLPCETREHVGDDSQILEPFALGSLFQGSGFQGFLSGMKGLEEQSRLARHVFSLPAIRLLIMAKEQCRLPGGKGCFGEALREGQSMIRHCARNRGDHPGGSPGRDGPFSDKFQKIFGQGSVEGQPGRHPALLASDHGGDPALRETAAFVKLLKQRRLFQDIPSAGVGSGEYLREGLLLFAVPDLRFHHIVPARLQCLHPEIAVEQNEVPGDDHRDELTDPLDRGGQGEAFLGSFYSRMRIAEVKLAYFDLPDLPNHLFHSRRGNRSTTTPSHPQKRHLRPTTISIARHADHLEERSSMFFSLQQFNPWRWRFSDWR